MNSIHPALIYFAFYSFSSSIAWSPVNRSPYYWHLPKQKVVIGNLKSHRVQPNLFFVEKEKKRWNSTVTGHWFITPSGPRVTSIKDGFQWDDSLSDHLMSMDMNRPLITATLLLLLEGEAVERIALHRRTRLPSRPPHSSDVSVRESAIIPFADGTWVASAVC